MLLDNDLVMFPDGSAQKYASNIIAESMYSQVDVDVYHTLIFDEITDHKKHSHAVSIDDKYITFKNGRHYMVKLLRD